MKTKKIRFKYIIWIVATIVILLAAIGYGIKKASTDVNTSATKKTTKAQEKTLHKSAEVDSYIGQ